MHRVEPARGLAGRTGKTRSKRSWLLNTWGHKLNPSRMALFDLTSAWMTGRHCELAARGYSRDGKKGLPQIEYGILSDADGRPVAVRVFAGNTADPVAFTDIVEVVRTGSG